MQSNISPKNKENVSKNKNDAQSKKREIRKSNNLIWDRKCKILHSKSCSLKSVQYMFKNLVCFFESGYLTFSIGQKHSAKQNQIFSIIWDFFEMIWLPCLIFENKHPKGGCAINCARDKVSAKAGCSGIGLDIQLKLFCPTSHPWKPGEKSLRVILQTPGLFVRVSVAARTPLPQNCAEWAWSEAAPFHFMIHFKVCAKTSKLKCTFESIHFKLYVIRACRFLFTCCVLDNSGSQVLEKQFSCTCSFQRCWKSMQGKARIALITRRRDADQSWVWLPGGCRYTGSA